MHEYFVECYYDDDGYERRNLSKRFYTAEEATAYADEMFDNDCVIAGIYCDGSPVEL